MLVMAVLLLAGTTFMTISSTESQIALNERVSVQATLIAEAAIHKAIAQLDINPAYTGEPNPADPEPHLGRGTFTVKVDPTAGCGSTPNSARILSATGKVPVRGVEARIEIQAIVDQYTCPFRWGAFATVDYLFLSSLWTKQTLTDRFDSSAAPYSAPGIQGGNVGANGGLYLWYVDIMGSATSGSWISSTGGSTASSPPVEKAPDERFFDVTADPAATSGPPLSGSVTLAPGTYIYSASSLSIPDNTSLTASGGPVTIYVTGQVTLGNNVTLGNHPATNLTIITKSDGDATQQVSFTTGSNFKLFGALYGKNTNIILGDNAEIYGSMIGRKITRGTPAGEFQGSWWQNPPKFHFDYAMHNKEIPIGRFSIRRGTWREVIP